MDRTLGLGYETGSPIRASPLSFIKNEKLIYVNDGKSISFADAW